MPCFGAVAGSAVCAIPDDLTGHLAAEGEVFSTFDVVTSDPFFDLIANEDNFRIYAAEIYAQPLSDRS